VYKYKGVTALFIPYGAPYNDFEKLAYNKLRDIFLSLNYKPSDVIFREYHTNIAPLDSSKFGAGYIIPMRNALLASYASLYGNNIFLASNWRLNDYAGACDKGLSFFSQISELLSQQYQTPVRVWSPFLHWKKEQAVTWLMNRYPKNYVEILYTTASCYNPDVFKNKACGDCYACWKAAKTFRTVNIWDTMQEKFATNPFATSNAKVWEQKEKEKGR
jgi:hypothetical protein